MQSKYTEEFVLSPEVEDSIVERLSARGIHEDADGYDDLFEEELELYFKQVEADNADMLADRREAVLAIREYFDNLPGGKADYEYG